MIHMATPKKPGQRVMLTEGYGAVKLGQIGRVTRRQAQEITEPTWSVRLDSGESVEVQEAHLYILTE